MRISFIYSVFKNSSFHSILQHSVIILGLFLPPWKSKLFFLPCLPFPRPSALAMVQKYKIILCLFVGKVIKIVHQPASSCSSPRLPPPRNESLGDCLIKPKIKICFFLWLFFFFCLSLSPFSQSWWLWAVLCS